MARKKRRGGRGFRVGKYVGLTFRLLGLGVAASPAIRAVAEHIGTPAQIPRNVAYNYSGVDIETGAFSPGHATAGIASVIVGVLIAKIGGMLARRF